MMKIKFIRKHGDDKKSQTLVLENKKDLNVIKLVAEGELFKRQYLKDIEFSDKFYVKVDGKKMSFGDLLKLCAKEIDKSADKEKSKKKSKNKVEKKKKNSKDDKKKSSKNKTKSKKKEKSAKKILKDSKKVSDGLYRAPDGHAIISRR